MSKTVLSEIYVVLRIFVFILLRLHMWCCCSDSLGAAQTKNDQNKAIAL